MGKPKRKLTPYNKCMSRELKGKMSGKTKAQRAALFKAAAKRCSKNPTKKGFTMPKRASPKKRSNPTGGNRRMANSFNMNKIYGLVRKAAIVLPAIAIATHPTWSTESKITIGIKQYFGYDRATGTFAWSELWKGWGPAIGAQVITRVVPAIGRLIRSIF